MPDPMVPGAPSYDRLSEEAKLAVDSFLFRYEGKSRLQYSYAIRRYLDWLHELGLEPLTGVKRLHVEKYVRYLSEDRGNSAASISHGLTPVAGFYKLAFLDGVIVRDPAQYIRRPKVWRGMSTKGIALDPFEYRAIIKAAATPDHPCDAGIVALIFQLGLRASEAISIRIEDYATEEQGHRVLKFIRKGGKPATIPIPLAVMRLMEISRGDRESGPLLAIPMGPGKRAADRTMSRVAIASGIHRLCVLAHIEKRVLPHDGRRTYITNGLRSGIPLYDMQRAAGHEDPRSTADYDMDRHNLDSHAVHIVSAKFATAA